MDELAAELGMDPLELRQLNWIKHSEFPYTTIAGLTYDSGNYEAATARAKDLFGYDGLRREQAERRQRRDRVQLGIGVSTYTEMGALAPSRWLGQHGYTVGGWETATVRLLPTGRVEAVVGTSPHGQGHVTAFSQIVADTMGVAFDDVDVLHGDTDIAALGAGYLRLTLGRAGRHGGVAGGAEGGGQGPHDRRAPPGGQPQTTWSSPTAVRGARGPGGGENHSGGGRRGVRRARPAAGGRSGALAEATFDPESFSYPNGTHLCAVEVDTQTGR